MKAIESLRAERDAALARIAELEKSYRIVERLYKIDRQERIEAEARIAEAAKLHRPVPTGREMYVTGNAGEIYGVEPTYICPSGCNHSVSFFKGDECESWKLLGLNEGSET